MHNVGSLLKVSFNKEKEKALEKEARNASPLFQSYVLLVSLLFTFYSEPFHNGSAHSLRLLSVHPLLCSFMEKCDLSEGKLLEGRRLAGSLLRTVEKRPALPFQGNSWRFQHFLLPSSQFLVFCSSSLRFGGTEVKTRLLRNKPGRDLWC